ncbi:MAG: IPT/TIG domain-containing protein [Jatrophihabitans sp.]|uniref:IPT/TIG domain-containing protein n=1 Tax=Jatrophihabitans sp. TaxID=1932789 RepID=UPI003F821245
MPRAARSGRNRCALAAVLAAASLVVVLPAQDAHAAMRNEVGTSAAQYATRAGYRIGIAVYDTKNHTLHGSGAYRSAFASESVVKTFIATRLLVTGQMVGVTAQMAYKMITQSDDNMATALYGRVGGDSLIDWVKSYFRVPDLGSRPWRAGWWGTTRITPAGLVKFYVKAKANRRVGPWLLNAMHHATKYGSDGTYQFFGLPSATTHPAVKQGWGGDYDYTTACFNTTGFVDNDRYAVAILARGPMSSYGARIGSMLTAVARRLLPGGVYPAPIPFVSALSRHAGATTGHQSVTVRGSDFSGVTGVLFGTTRASNVHVLSPGVLTADAPPQTPRTVAVHVQTTHGTSVPTLRSAFTYGAPPVVTSLSRSSGAVGGGDQLTVRGHDFGSLVQVKVGTAVAKVVGAPTGTSVTVVVPKAAAAGTVHVQVVTIYAGSAPGAADQYAYVGVPTITAVSPDHGPAAGGTTATIQGTGFAGPVSVSFGGVAATVQQVTPTSITVLTRHGTAGPAVPVTVSTQGGTATKAGAFTYE